MLGKDSGQEAVKPSLLPPFHQVSMNHSPQEGCLWSMKWSDVERQNLSLTESQVNTVPELCRLAMDPNWQGPLFFFTQQFATLFGFCIFPFWFSYSLGFFEIGLRKKWHIKGGRDLSSGRTRCLRWIRIGRCSYALPSPLHLSSISVAEIGAKEPPERREKDSYIGFIIEIQICKFLRRHWARIRGFIRSQFLPRSPKNPDRAFIKRK